MILSHKHQFIFIKTRKTAGTSLEIALGDICGDDDIITRISMKDEVERRKQFRGAQHYRLPVSEYAWADWKKLLTKGRFKRFENHDPADKIVKYVPWENWRSYFKFCFERNPWDKMVSHYYWKKEAYQLKNFQEYLDRGQEGEIVGFQEILNTRSQYFLNGELAVDKIYKYEELQQALDDITQRLNLSVPLTLPGYKAKGQHREKNATYRETLSPDQADWIAEQFRWEIEHFNYQF